MHRALLSDPIPTMREEREGLGRAGQTSDGDKDPPY